MPRGARNHLAVYLADLFAVAGTVLLVTDGLVLARAGGGTRPVLADLALVAGGLVAHRVATTGLREAPAIALAALVLGSLAVAWLTERWWVPAAAGAAAAGVAPQLLSTRRAVLWGLAGALLALAGIATAPVAALVVAAGIGAVSSLSLRLATELRSSTSRTTADLEQALELERLRGAEVLARLNRLEGRVQGGARRSVLRAVLTRRLSVVQAVAQTAARDLKRALATGAPADVAEAARRNAGRAERLAQLAAGGEARERETTLSLVWARVLDHLSPEIAAAVAPGGSGPATAHHVEVSFPESLPPVAGGTEEWAQMLAALVDNAVEAMPGGGVVRARAEASDRPGYARVSVEDNGPGIAPEVLPHVLEPFYTSRAEEGAEGLGLATVASLVEALDGEVHITSALGAGTKVEIEVPFYAAAARPALAEPVRLEGCVLLADDDKEVRRSMARLLESFGLEVLDVDSGTVAFAHLSAHPDRFRAAILDVVMPGTPVSEVVIGFRDKRPGFPFLLVSGLASARLVDSLLALGGVRFLKKPFRRDELYGVLRDLFTVGPGRKAAPEP